MATNPTDSASPEVFSETTRTSDGILRIIDTYSTGGLTKREHMAIEFTKALLTNPNFTPVDNNENIYNAINMGIFSADELIKQLNEQK